MGIGMYVRDTALKFNQNGIDLTKAVINNFTKSTFNAGAYSSNASYSPTANWNMDIGGQKEDIKWLL